MGGGFRGHGDSGFESFHFAFCRFHNGCLNLFRVTTRDLFKGFLARGKFGLVFIFHWDFGMALADFGGWLAAKWGGANLFFDLPAVLGGDFSIVCDGLGGWILRECVGVDFGVGKG